MTKKEALPASAEELRSLILERYDTLSKRLQQIARYVLDEPNAMALETLAVLAERCDVQPSTIVRFAKAFGFDGATQMQRLFRDGLLSGSGSQGYGERVRQFKRTVEGKAVNDPSQLLAEFVEGNVMAMQHLGQAIDHKTMTSAVKMIDKAETVYVAGFRRSFPVAAYLAYTLHQVDKKVLFIDSIGGMTRQQIHTIKPNDLLIVVSYHPYAEETVELIDVAQEAQCGVLSITDSLVSPVAKPATLILQVREAEIRKFRSLSTSMCLAQALVISYAFSKASQGRIAPRRSSGRSKNK